MAKGLRGIVSSPETFYKPSTQELAVHKEVAQMMGSFATLEAGKVDTGIVIPVPGQKPHAQSRSETVGGVTADLDTNKNLAHPPIEATQPIAVTHEASEAAAEPSKHEAGELAVAEGEMNVAGIDRVSEEDSDGSREPTVTARLKDLAQKIADRRSRDSTSTTDQKATHIASPVNLESTSEETESNSENEPEKETAFKMRDVGIAGRPSARREADEPSQDVALVDEKLGIYGVVDGMGGYEGGRMAANTAKIAAHKYISTGRSEHQRQPTKVEHVESELIKLCYAIKNEMAVALQDTEANAVGTFVTAREIDGQKYLGVLHAGDTRMFIKGNNGEIRSITTDQSRGNRVFNSLRDMKFDNNDSNAASAEIRVIEVADGERVLLCSDGITGDWDNEFLTAEEMQRGFMQKTAQESAEMFEMMSKKVDDKTAVVLDI